MNRCLMVAGPNGAGKTTLIQYLRETGIDLGYYINPDDIARDLEGTYEQRVREAQTIADKQRESCIADKRDFTFETVMSHPSKIDVLLKAKAAGFSVELFFVATDDPRTSIERVQLRVEQGGHDVPQDKIVSRWSRTMDLLHVAIQTADRSFVYDNSAAGIEAGLVLVFTATQDTNRKLDPTLLKMPPPRWLQRYVLEPLGMKG
jgi:predicted ABC-type ATPase